jgi:hypothetical protein
LARATQKNLKTAKTRLKFKENEKEVEQGTIRKAVDEKSTKVG